MTRALPGPDGPPCGRHDEASLAALPRAVAAASLTAALTGEDSAFSSVLASLISVAGAGFGLAAVAAAGVARLAVELTLLASLSLAELSLFSVRADLLAALALLLTLRSPRFFCGACASATKAEACESSYLAT